MLGLGVEALSLDGAAAGSVAAPEPQPEHGYEESTALNSGLAEKSTPTAAAPPEAQVVPPDASP